MKRQFIYLLFVLAGAVSMTSCENWLDETSHSEIRDEDHYSNEEGFRQTLIGCYINMTDESLYGKELSWGMVETLARQFQPYSTLASATNYNIQNYNFFCTSLVSECVFVFLLNRKVMGESIFLPLPAYYLPIALYKSFGTIKICFVRSAHFATAPCFLFNLNSYFSDI